MVIKGYRAGPLLKKTGREILGDNVLGLAAQTAYAFFFSLFPLLLFLAPLLALVGDKRQIMNWLMGQLATTVPPDAMKLVQGIAANVVFAPNAPGLISIGILLAAWSGSNIFGTLMGALNTAYDVKETRPWWKQQLIRLASLVVAGGIFLLATVVLLGGDTIAGWLGTHLGLGGTTVFLWNLIQFPLAIAFLVLAAALTYYFLPNVKQKKGQVIAAALVTTILWLVATFLFRLYVQHFGGYNKAYGTIGAVMLLLTWMYYSMLVILAGGELASELHHGTGRVTTEPGKLYMGRIATGTVPAAASTDRVERVQPMYADGGRSEQR